MGSLVRSVNGESVQKCITSSFALRGAVMSQRIFSGFYSAATAMITCIHKVARYDATQKDWQANAGSYDRCPDCGGWKAKKAYRCRACSPRPLEAAQARWNPDAKSGTKRKRARAVVPELGVTCSRCGEAKPLERHHVDGDTGNNDMTNISVLCRRCHMEVDGRLEALRDMPRPVRVMPSPCDECGRLYKPLRRGLCHACNERRRRREKRGVCHDEAHGIRRVT
jgi:hypothetical protein